MDTKLPAIDDVVVGLPLNTTTTTTATKEHVPSSSLNCNEMNISTINTPVASIVNTKSNVPFTTSNVPPTEPSTDTQTTVETTTTTTTTTAPVVTNSTITAASTKSSQIISSVDSNSTAVDGSEKSSKESVPLTEQQSLQKQQLFVSITTNKEQQQPQQEREEEHQQQQQQQQRPTSQPPHEHHYPPPCHYYPPPIPYYYGYPTPAPYYDAHHQHHHQYRTQPQQYDQRSNDARRTDEETMLNETKDTVAVESVKAITVSATLPPLSSSTPTAAAAATTTAPLPVPAKTAAATPVATSNIAHRTKHNRAITVTELNTLEVNQPMTTTKQMTNTQPASIQFVRRTLSTTGSTDMSNTKPIGPEPFPQKSPSTTDNKNGKQQQQHDKDQSEISILHILQQNDSVPVTKSPMKLGDSLLSNECPSTPSNVFAASQQQQQQQQQQQRQRQQNPSPYTPDQVPKAIVGYKRYFVETSSATPIISNKATSTAVTTTKTKDNKIPRLMAGVNSTDSGNNLTFQLHGKPNSTISAPILKTNVPRGLMHGTAETTSVQTLQNPISPVSTSNRLPALYNVTKPVVFVDQLTYDWSSLKIDGTKEWNRLLRSHTPIYKDDDNVNQNECKPVTALHTNQLMQQLKESLVENIVAPNPDSLLHRVHKTFLEEDDSLEKSKVEDKMLPPADCPEELQPLYVKAAKYYRHLLEDRRQYHHQQQQNHTHRQHHPPLRRKFQLMSANELRQCVQQMKNDVISLSRNEQQILHTAGQLFLYPCSSTGSSNSSSSVPKQKPLKSNNDTTNSTTLHISDDEIGIRYRNHFRRQNSGVGPTMLSSSLPTLSATKELTLLWQDDDITTLFKTNKK